MVVEYINISEKYNSLMEALNRVGIGIDIVSKDHKILYQNQTLKKKFGDCVGRSCYEKYMNLRQPCEFCPMERAIKNNVVESLELTGADGRDYELFSAPLPNPDGMIDRVAEVIIDITERKNAEKQLKYKDHIINSTSNIIATCDLDGIMNFVNPAFLEIWGYENVSEVYGKHFKQFWNVEENLEEIINTLMTDHKWFGEVKATKKDGKLFDVQVSASLLVDDKCNPIGFMSSSMDITDRKLNEQRLIRSEEQFCKTFHESVVLMCITTIDEGKIIEVNNSFLKTFGFSREEVIGKTSRELDLLFDYEERDRKIKDVTKDSGIEIRDVRFKVKDGSVIYGLISLSQISLQDQSYLLTMITDITERKLAEHKIAESEEKFSKTFHESIVIMAISTIEEGKFLEVNDAFLKTLGFSKKEVIGKTSQELNIFLNFKERREIIKEVKEQKFAKNREMLIRKKDGTIIQGLFSVSQIMLQDRPYLLTMMNDITERKRAEQKLKESEEKFKIISEQNLMGILILQDNVIKYLNKAMGDMYGYSIEEVYNWKPNEFLKIIAPEFLEYVKEQAKKKQMGDSDQKSHYFLQGVKKNGEHIWIENFSKTIQYNNRPADLITQIDITEKRKFELDIRDSEEKYRTLFEGANDAIFLMKDYKFIECNKKTLEVFGYDDESEILGFFPWEISPLYQPDGKDSKITAIEYMDFALNGKPARFYWKHKRKDGNFMDAEVSLNRILIGKDKYIQAIVRDITEKIQAEKMLEESEKKYRLISENANDLISVLNNKYEYEYINEQAYVNILGYSENDLIGKNAWLNVHPEDREEFLKSRDLSENGFIARNGSDKEVLRIKHKQGHYVWIEYTSRIFVDDKGKPKVLLISRDITNRKMAENELTMRNVELSVINKIITLGNESHNLQDFLVEAYNQVLDVVKFDKGGVYLFNPKTNHNVLVLHKNVHPKFIEAVEDVDISQDPFKSIFDVENPIYFEDFSKLMEGSKELGVYSAVIVPLRSKDTYVGSLNYGSPIRQTLSQNDLDLLVAIGKQMGIIIQKFDSEKKLKESEKKYRHLFNDSPIGIFLFDENGIVLDGNIMAFNEFSAVPLKNNTNKSFTELVGNFKNAGEIIEIFSSRFKEQREGKKMEPVTFKTIRNDGIEKWAYWQCSKIQLQDRNIIQSVILDITDRKEAEKLIIEENRKLQELSNMRRDLITRISHELKTPITSAYGASQALLELHKSEMSWEMLEFLDIMQRGIKRLKKLVESLLDVSKLDSKVLSINLKKENILKITREHVDELKYNAKSRDLTINVDLPDQFFIEIDKNLFGQVITNILSNAINNTPPGGNISILFEEKKENIDIIIRDTGVGITEQEMPRLFQKFGKIERYGKGYDVYIEGTGLGLFISKEIINMHGGKILVESEGRDKGATFKIRLFKTYYEKNI